MSTSWNVILKRFAVLALIVAILFGIIMLFTFDIIKIQWPGFMEIQPNHRQMRDPLPVPSQSIPVEGPAYIPNMGAPQNPVSADAASLARGEELFNITCTACHGTEGKGNGPVAAFLQNKKPIDLTGPIGISLSDGAIFMTISNGTPGGMPALNENLTVRERWDVVNYVRQLQQKK
jgi:mono/diheme cytochrome c family protein